MKELTKPWILVGYELFSQKGPNGLKIEEIARRVNKSKSSFYHHFADLEIFTQLLLEYHLIRAKEISEKENLCKNIDPELINILIEAKTDLLFNRQLRINRETKEFKNCIELSDKFVGEGFLNVFSKELNLEINQSEINNFFQLVLENFYLKLTEDKINYNWLYSYFVELQKLVENLTKK